MISQAYTHAQACVHKNTPACVRVHTHTHTRKKCVCVCVCVFPIFQFYLTQNFTESGLTTDSQEDDELQWQDVKTSNTTPQCTTQYY